MTDKNLLVITPHRKEPGKQRIAAYCRVSSRSDEQLNSLANQIDFYRSRFENDNTALFVGIYAEEGLSGTQAESRPQFMKMIEDCRIGHIDCIWTKSVSRFGRNTVDTLIYTRELRSLGIDVFFEKENIHSTESSGELMLTLMAAFAESESEMMSENIKWGKRRRYEQGITGSITLKPYYYYHYTTTNKKPLAAYRCMSHKTQSAAEVPGQTYIPPHKATFNRNASAKLIAYRERYCKPPKERPMLCTDVRIPTDLPQKAFCRAWNLIVAKKLRYQATLRSTVDNAEDILVRYRAEEMCLLIDEIGKINEFSYPLMLKTLDRVVVNANGKLTFIFQSGIKITV